MATHTVTIDPKYLAGAADASLDFTPPDADREVVQALAMNAAFPFRQIEFGTIAAKVSSDRDLKFAEGAGQVVFKASGGAFAGFGVYIDPVKLVKGMAVDEQVADALDMAASNEDLFLALKWGYDVNASAEGSMALGAPGKVTFGASGKREALYAVIRRFSKEAKSLDAIAATARSWMLPSQVANRRGELAPGTWILAETDSSIALSLGVQYGYDFNWVREAKALGLAGDIGLRLNLGVSAALSFSAAGNFAIVISRESADETDQAIRFRLFRLRRKGWGFAFNASADVQGDVNDFLPAFDEFVKAVFGVHGAQVLKDLKAIENWTDPKKSLPELFGEAGVNFGKKLLKDVTGIDPESAFNKARDRVVALVDKWNELPHTVATRLWTVVEEQANERDAHKALEEIRSIATLISEANRDSVREPLARLLGNVAFFQTAAGGWLESAAAGGIVRVLNNTAAFQDLQKVARTTLDLLDGDALESSLVKLQTFVEEHLQLESLFKQAHLDELVGVSTLDDFDQASFDKLDAWLKARLQAFVEDRLDLARVNQIRQAIFLFIKRGRTFYDQTLKALNRKYEFSFAATFQQDTTRTALLDFVLDGSRPEAFDALKLALGGQYDRLLVEQMPGVTLNMASLTHQIERTTHVEINLPWSSSAVDHINSSLARVDAVDEDEGRVLVYELAGNDLVTERNKRNSRLAIGGFLRADAGGVRVHNTELTYSYSLRQVQRDMKRADLQYQLKPYIETYFGDVFKAQPGGGGTFENWIGDLDNHIDALENNGTDNFGDTLLSLQVSLPAEAVSVWKDAPGEPADHKKRKVPQYLEMSRRIQATMRRLIPLVFFQDLKNFAAIERALPLLVYQAMPPSTSATLTGDALTLNTDTDYFWDWPDEKLRRRIVHHPQTSAVLATILARTNFTLKEAGHPSAAFYATDRLHRIQDEVAANETSDLSPLGHLLFVEDAVIRAARTSGFAIAKFRKAAGSKPSEAVKALATFGSTLTEAFNAKITTTYGGGALRPLGTALFLEAAAALTPGLAARPTALLELIVLKGNATFALADYLNGVAPPKKDILERQPIVNVM
jgi:hypothetical protein